MPAERSADDLTRAFVGSVDDVAGVSAADLELVQRALDGELDTGALDGLLARVAVEPGLAAAWNLGRELRDGLCAPLDLALPSTRSSRRAWLVSGAAAAALAVLLVVVVRSPESPTVERQPSSSTLRSALADGAALPRQDFELVWTADPDAERFTVEVFDADLRMLHQEIVRGQTRLLVPAAALGGQPKGALIYWRVEATDAGGEIATSPTFVQTIE